MVKVAKYIFGLFVLLNLIGVFMPEIGFDALWYHLVLPKLWLLKRQWYFPGGLLYYSAMPRLFETISIPLLKYGGYVGPKLLQFGSGLLVSLLIFKLVKKLSLRVDWAWLAALMFYGSWLVSWQSSSAYVDLFRSGLETLALYLLISRKGTANKWLAGALLGLSIGTKWLGLISLGIYALVFEMSLIGPALLVALPWFLIAYRFTGNPIYPLLEPFMGLAQMEQVGAKFYQPVEIVKRLVLLPGELTFPLDDFISPLMGLVFVFCLLAALRAKRKPLRQIAWVGILGAVSVQLTTPPSSRYFLPFMPAVIVAGVVWVGQIDFRWQGFLAKAVILGAGLILLLRLGSLAKFSPYISERMNRNQLLASLSGRLPDTFIDADGYIAGKIPRGSRVLIDGLHNLYYFPYDFDHSSWVRQEDWQDYDYLVIDKKAPDWLEASLIHINSLGIRLYRLDD